MKGTFTLSLAMLFAGVQGAFAQGTRALVIARTTDPQVQAVITTLAQHDTAALMRMLTADPSLVRAADANGSSMLMHAAYAGTLEGMHALIGAGADVNARNDRKATALHWAATDAAKLRLLLSKGADINARTVEGRTALHTAAMQPGGAPVVKVLLEGGADVNARSIIGQTPLFPAVGASLDTVRLLLAKGANPNARLETGVTPLMVTRVPGAAALLIEGGADGRAVAKKGETAIGNLAAIGDLGAVERLLISGVRANVADHRDYTPLMLAAQNDQGQLEIVRLLLANGADLTATAQDETALTLAAKRGETAVTRFLRESQSVYWTVVLHVAAYARVPASELADAEAAAAKAYARAGVRLVWTGGATATAAPDGALHLDVFLLTAEMTERLRPAASALGKASHKSRKAFIFYERIVRHAMRTSSAPSRTLGYVLAHEIGHMILPEYSHAPSGLMRPICEGSIVDVPDFAPTQAVMIRTMVTAAN